MKVKHQLMCGLTLFMCFWSEGTFGKPWRTGRVQGCTRQQIQMCSGHCLSVCRSVESRPFLEVHGQLAVSYTTCVKECQALCRGSETSCQPTSYFLGHPLTQAVEKWFQKEGCRPLSFWGQVRETVSSWGQWIRNVWVSFWSPSLKKRGAFSRASQNKISQNKRAQFRGENMAASPMLAGSTPQETSDPSPQEFDGSYPDTQGFVIQIFTPPNF